MVRKSLPYQGIARRALSAGTKEELDKILYDTDIDISGGKENMKFRPLHDHVIVTRSKADEVSQGGIFIPVTAQEKTTEGVVVAVGKGTMLEDGTVVALDVRPGDKVLFDKYASAEVKIHGEDFVVLRENGIICILDS